MLVHKNLQAVSDSPNTNTKSIPTVSGSPTYLTAYGVGVSVALMSHGPNYATLVNTVVNVVHINDNDTISVA